MPIHSDSDRAEWVGNDEGLYDLWRNSGQLVIEFVRENRTLIDEVINEITSGKRQAHYMKYEKRDE